MLTPDELNELALLCDTCVVWARKCAGLGTNKNLQAAYGKQAEILARHAAKLRELAHAVAHPGEMEVIEKYPLFDCSN